ncbi:5-(carboxyamino)imidazole ribonucleotide mutase [bacterium]|nr:5-(carboxyamino)imidazole ribonucleotide mutase [bacterium]
MKVAILMGSESDRSIVERAVPYLEYFGLEHEIHVLSAHRNATQVDEFSANLEQNGFGCVIAAAGMANHLAGALAARTNLPVLGVPLPGGVMDGLDALLSTVQMPGGVPVATFAVGKAGMSNAAVFAARMAGVNDEAVAQKLHNFAENGFKLLK